MPGPQVKNWKMYEALRREGKSKESAARIVNSRYSKRRKKRKKKKGKYRK